MCTIEIQIAFHFLLKRHPITSFKNSFQIHVIRCLSQYVSEQICCDMQQTAFEVMSTAFVFKSCFD